MVTFTQTLLIVVITVLTVIITGIGVQLFLLLKEIRSTVTRANSILDQADGLINKLSHPAASVNNLITGLKEGVTLIETISGIFSRRKTQSSEYPSYDEL